MAANRSGELNAPKDFEAVREVLSGNPEAFERIVRGYQNLVASVAYRLGVPRNEVEDIVSEVMIKVYRNLAGYRPEFALSTWIYRITVNHVHDWLHRHRFDREARPVPETLADSAESAPDRVAGLERAERVREALAEVPEMYRVPLVLMHVEERSVGEIGRILALPENTVKTRLARGRARLAAILRERCPDLMPDPAQGEAS